MPETAAMKTYVGGKKKKKKRVKTPLSGGGYSVKPAKKKASSY